MPEKKPCIYIIKVPLTLRFTLEFIISGDPKYLCRAVNLEFYTNFLFPSYTINAI